MDQQQIKEQAKLARFESAIKTIATDQNTKEFIGYLQEESDIIITQLSSYEVRKDAALTSSLTGELLAYQNLIKIFLKKA